MFTAKAWTNAKTGEQKVQLANYLGNGDTRYYYLTGKEAGEWAEQLYDAERAIRRGTHESADAAQSVPGCG